jgi:hypothetical protein|tara:strand:- start:2 stop:289 length:288 start_codon:yes stop_codon:yes gene_type:complete
VKTEKALQKYCKKQAHAKGVLWYKIKFEGQRGCPDVLLAYKGKIIFVELKSPTGKGKLSELQSHQIKKLTDAGIAARVTDSREEVDKIIQELLNP